ncbi:hypothetical protein D3C73_1387380 [compost metagenome]
MQHVQVFPLRRRLAIDAGDQALAFGAIDDLERLAGDGIAHLDGFAHYVGLQLLVSERFGAFGFQLINGFAGSNKLAVLNCRCVPDRRSPRTFLDGGRDVGRRRYLQLGRVIGAPARGRNL